MHASKEPTDGSAPPADGAERLDSWKEIASFLGRSVLTAQRWEKAEGLPVHRHTHEKQATVYAFRTEIERWRADRHATQPNEPLVQAPSRVEPVSNGTRS